MKNNSIREALPRLAKYMILCMILLILPANIGFQMYIHHENQKASANEMFRQVGLLIETNENDMKEVKKDFSERCIRAADMAAYFVQYNPEVKDSQRTGKKAGCGRASLLFQRRENLWRNSSGILRTFL